MNKARTCNHEASDVSEAPKYEETLKRIDSSSKRINTLLSFRRVTWLFGLLTKDDSAKA
ncbi:MAG: hypothetical protein JW942_07165 [Opitutales bacterium]|nr:hypothetical protein [Opitutales bacterium]